MMDARQIAAIEEMDELAWRIWVAVQLTSLSERRRSWWVPIATVAGVILGSALTVTSKTFAFWGN